MMENIRLFFEILFKYISEHKSLTQIIDEIESDNAILRNEILFMLRENKIKDNIIKYWQDKKQ
jgi:hypothetical protein